MNPNAFLITSSTKLGPPRIHRVTCKRVKNGISVSLADVSLLEAATPATCCRPNPIDTKLAVEAALLEKQDSYVNEESIRIQQDVNELGTDDVVPAPKVARRTGGGRKSGNPVEDRAANAARGSRAKPKTLLWDGHGPKHLWASLGRDGSHVLAGAAGAGFEADNELLAVTFTGSEASKAAKVVEHLWADAQVAFKPWKKATIDTAFESADRWGTPAYNLMQRFYRNYALGFADAFSSTDSRSKVEDQVAYEAGRNDADARAWIS